MATWVVNVDFQEGAGWEDISGSVLLATFKRRRQIWNRLQPTVNTLDFQVKTEASALIAKFMVASKDILVAVTKDAAAYFTGMIQPSYTVNVGSRVSPFDISCVDNGYRIKRRILANINWTNYKVCDPANVSTSIVHQLMVAAGLATSDVYTSVGTVDKTIDRFVGVAGEADVWDLMAKILFDFGYVFFFRPDGKLDIFSFAQSSIITTDKFSSSASFNIVGGLEVQRNEQDYEAVRVTWSTHQTLVNALLFSDTTNGDALRKCNIEVASGAYWPTDANLRDIYADYNVDGYDLIATSAVVLSIEKDVAIEQDTFTDEIKRAKIKFHNSGAIPAFIRRFDIYGTAIVKDQYNVQTSITVSGTNKYLDIDSDYLYASADADLLCDAVAQYYYNADMRYGLRSRSEFEPGAFVYVEESQFLAINNLCVVQEVTDYELTGEHSYVLEGVAEYSAGTITSTGSTVPPTPYTRGNTLTIGASGYSGFADSYCDGTADQTEINAAISEVSSVYGGGTVRLVGGTFVVVAAIEMLDSVSLEIDPSATVEKNADDYAIECVGSSGTHKSNVAIRGSGTITRNAADENAKPLVYFEYVDDSAIDNVTVTGSYNDGIYMVNCDNVKLGGALTISSCAGTGLKTLQSVIIVAAGVTISACAIGCEMWSSISTNMIANGNCESTDEPMPLGETTPVLTKCSFARDSGQAYGGTYSYKITKTENGASYAICNLCDADDKADLHGLTAGKSYLWKLKVYLPSGIAVPGPTFSQFYSTNGANWAAVNSVQPLAIYDQWQEINNIISLPSTATGYMAYIYLSAAITLDEYIYIDDVSLYEFDETDSGCQLVNSSVADCTDVGISVINSQAIIQNNQVTGCTNQGIEVLAGYRNIVSGNRAYNNGSDTGIANDNQDNFYDAGIDTQNSENSWNYLPVTGEPSLGTPHARVTNVLNADPSDTNWHSLDMVALNAAAPGVKAVTINMAIRCGTNYRQMYVSNASGGSVYGRAASHASSYDVWSSGIVPVDSDGCIWYSVSNSDVTLATIDVTEYWM